VSAHRFRHTVGTQLAERGAKLHTIMKVLGHTSVSMALVYAQISDQEVLRDYKAVLGPGATIAGPAAEELRDGALPDSAVVLRARREIEETLALDAAARGWDREVERHRCTTGRIEKLLTDLGEPLDNPGGTPENDDAEN
jgi:hypothetical protein